ncbi:MAG TPA: stage II sporulation protein P [Ruminococcaceae bacterium]|nr:stage II sporulation protein P [Oscillospiraceae bacterium]
MRHSGRIRPLLGWMAVIAVSAGVLAIFPSLGVSADTLFGKAAAASAMLQLPEGGMAYLQNRFRDDLAQDEPVPQPADPQRESVPPSEASAPSSLPQQDILKEENETVIPETPASPSIETIAPENRGTITEQTYTVDQSSLYIPLSAGYLKNSTSLSNQQVSALLAQPLELTLEDTDQPQVLIVHTHATESFEPFDRDFCDTSYTWRSTDNSQNVVRLGDILAQQLQQAGIGVIHDATQHDYPSYNGSYERSASTIRKWLEQYPTIKVVIDLHRDAIESPAGNLIKPVAVIDGEKTAQVMIIAGCDDGTMNMPNWDQNLRWAAALQSTAESMYPGLTRPIFFCYRKYNMDLTGGSLLIEFGSHGNTLAEASRAAMYMGKAMAKALLETKAE